MNEQETWWAGEAGNEYTKRNRVDWRARIPFWHDIMKFTGARSVFEVGCNAGWNLSAIRESSPHRVSLYGYDLNEKAFNQAKHDLGPHAVYATDAEPSELVFTAGVLIHVAPENLREFMQQLIDASAHWVLAVEYAADEEQMIEYRGQSNLLWKRPYGKLYEDMGLKVVHSGEATGFDRCQYWLCEKQ